MKVLIVSDSHKANLNIEKALDKEGPVDMIIHCGDIEGAEDYLEEYANCPLYAVAGNNDFFSKLNSEIIVNIANYRAMVTHGHYYYVSMGVSRLVEEAKRKEVDIVMYGHTHKPHIEIVDGIMVINPGSISYPRQPDKTPTYVVMEIDEYNDANYKLKYIK